MADENSVEPTSTSEVEATMVESYPPASWLRTILIPPILALLTVLYALPTMVGGFFKSKWWIARGTGDWSIDVVRLCGVKIRVRGQEHLRLDVPSFFVSNHQSALDIPILISLMRGHVRFMAKRELFSIPFFGWAITLGGYIPVDRGNSRKTLRVLKERFAALEKDPVSVLVFPEGTRSKDGVVLPFRKGSIKLCQYAKLPIVPVSIAGSFKVHQRKALRVNPGEVTVTFGKPIPADEAGEMNTGDLLTRLDSAIREQLGQTEAVDVAPVAGEGA